jgi:hypothetical protein
MNTQNLYFLGASSDNFDRWFILNYVCSLFPSSLEEKEHNSVLDVWPVMLREVEDDEAGRKNWALQFSEMVFLDEFSEWLAHWPVSRSPSHTHREKGVHPIKPHLCMSGRNGVGNLAVQRRASKKVSLVGSTLLTVDSCVDWSHYASSSPCHQRPLLLRGYAHHLPCPVSQLNFESMDCIYWSTESEMFESVDKFQNTRVSNYWLMGAHIVHERKINIWLDV